MTEINLVSAVRIRWSDGKFHRTCTAGHHAMSSEYEFIDRQVCLIPFGGDRYCDAQMIEGVEPIPVRDDGDDSTLCDRVGCENVATYEVKTWEASYFTCDDHRAELVNSFNGNIKVVSPISLISKDAKTAGQTEEMGQK